MKEVKTYSKPCVELTSQLVGSEKQVAWANDIRAKKMLGLFGKDNYTEADGYPTHVTHDFGRFDLWGYSPEDYDYNRKIIAEFAEKKTSAKWWIDHRSDEFEELVEAIFAE